MINSVVLVGRLTADPELKYTNSNLPVASFSIAVQRSFAKSGTERQTDFINIVAWNQTAEFICKYFAKGNLIGLEGSIQTRKYQDKQGNNRTSFEVVVSQAHFVESKGNSTANQNGGTFNNNNSAPSRLANQESPSFNNNDFDDFSEVPGDDEELPF